MTKEEKMEQKMKQVEELMYSMFDKINQRELPEDSKNNGVSEQGTPTSGQSIPTPELSIPTSTQSTQTSEQGSNLVIDKDNTEEDGEDGWGDWDTDGQDDTGGDGEDEEDGWESKPTSSQEGWGTSSEDGWGSQTSQPVQKSSSQDGNWSSPTKQSNTNTNTQHNLSKPKASKPIYAEEENVVSKEDVATFNLEDWNKAWMSALQSTKAFYDSEKAKKKLEKERQSNVQPKQCDESIMFKKNTATFNGQSFQYKVLQKEVDWGIAFTKSFTIGDKITNLDKLNERIIEDIKLTFGDLSRIKDIAVISGMLIINGVQYYPLCKDKDFLNGLPFDCADYFKSGAIAEIFDFGYLYYMPYLTNLKIDSMDFIIRKFAYDIGIKGKFKVPLVFKAFKNLKYFEINDMTFIRPGRDINEEVEEEVERHVRVSEIYDNYVAKNADAFTGWTFNCMKNYACNRGKKGFLRYAGGLVFRAGGFAIIGVNNLALKLVSGTVKQGAKLIKKAFSDDD